MHTFPYIHNFSANVELTVFNMPLNSEHKLQHEPAAKTDPAHASSENTDHVTSSGEKPTSMIEVITDTNFIPTLDNVPLSQKIKSYLLLLFTIFGGVTALYYLDFTLFQTSSSIDASTVVQAPLAPPAPTSFLESATEVGYMTVGVSTLIMILFFLTGTAHVDFWSLVMEYGWYTLPVVAGAGLIFVIAKENTEYTGDLE